MQISKSLLEKIVLEELHYVLSEQEGTGALAAPEETATRSWIKSLLPDWMSKEVKDWTTTAIEVIDPTGVSGWEEAGSSIKNFADEPSLANLGWAALASAAAIPIVGKIAKISKVGELSLQATQASRLLRSSGDEAAGALANRIDNIIASAEAAPVDARMAKRFGDEIAAATVDLERLAPGAEGLSDSLKLISKNVTRPGFAGWKRLTSRVLAQGGQSGAEFTGADVPWQHGTPGGEGDGLGGGDVLDILYLPSDQFDQFPPGGSGGPGGIPDVPDVALEPPASIATPSGGRASDYVPPPAQPARPVCNNRDILHDAYEMYDALKGWGTDEETVYRIIRKNSEPECMATLYRAYEEVLRREDDTDDGDLIDWLRDDGEDASAMKIKKGMISWSKSLRTKKRKPKKRKKK